MASYQVTGIRLSHPQGTNREISHIGYLAFGESYRMVITIDAAIARLEANPKEFFITDLRGLAYLKVAMDDDKPRYLKTRSFRHKDALLSLQRC